MKYLLIASLLFISSIGFSQSQDTAWATYESHGSRGLIIEERVKVIYTGTWDNKKIVTVLNLYNREIKLSPAQLSTLKKLASTAK